MKFTMKTTTIKNDLAGGIVAPAFISSVWPEGESGEVQFKLLTQGLVYCAEMDYKVMVTKFPPDESHEVIMSSLNSLIQEKDDILVSNWGYHGEPQLFTIENHRGSDVLRLRYRYTSRLGERSKAMLRIPVVSRDDIADSTSLFKHMYHQVESIQGLVSESALARKSYFEKEESYKKQIDSLNKAVADLQSQTTEKCELLLKKFAHVLNSKKRKIKELQMNPGLTTQTLDEGYNSHEEGLDENMSAAPSFASPSKSQQSIQQDSQTRDKGKRKLENEAGSEEKKAKLTDTQDLVDI